MSLPGVLLMDVMDFTPTIRFYHRVAVNCGLPRLSNGKNPPASLVDVGLIPGSGRSPGGGNDNPLQYSYLENLMDRGAWWATVHGVPKEADTTE